MRFLPLLLVHGLNSTLPFGHWNLRPYTYRELRIDRTFSDSFCMELDCL